MSDQQFQPNPAVQPAAGEEDPLTELARIVSGEEARSHDQQPASLHTPPGAGDDEFDLEAQLMAELGGEPAAPQPAPTLATPAQAAPFEGAPSPARFAGQPAPQVPPSEPAPAAAYHPPAPPVQPTHDSAWPPQTSAAAPEQALMNEHQHADDALDFGAAFTREVSALESQPPASAGIPPGVSHEPAMDDLLDRQLDETVHQLQLQVADDTGMEEVFADAFAKELSQEIASDAAGEPESVPLQGGWPEGETHAANLDFAAAAATASSASDPAVAPDFAGDLAHEITDPQMELAAQAVEFEAQLDDPRSERGERRSIWPAAVALLLALLGGAGAIAYGYLGSTDQAGNEPIVVLAERDPVKVEPEDPGGTVIANQDKASYDRVAGRPADESGQDRLVSGTEEPIELSASRQPTAADAASLLPAKDEARLPRSSQPVDTQNPLPLMAPRKVRTVAVKPDGTIISADGTQVAGLTPRAVTPQSVEATPAANAIDGAITTGEPAVPTRSPLPLQSTAVAFAAETPPESQAQAQAIASSVGEGQDDQAVTVARVEPVEEAAPTAAASAATVATQPAQAGEQYVVQISSQRSLEAAEATYENLKQRFSGLLADKGKDIQRAEVEGKGTFFRVRVPAGSKEAAVDLCSRYQSAGGSCFVTR